MHGKSGWQTWNIAAPRQTMWSCWNGNVRFQTSLHYVPTRWVFCWISLKTFSKLVFSEGSVNVYPRTPFVDGAYVKSKMFNRLRRKCWRKCYIFLPKKGKCAHRQHYSWIFVSSEGIFLKNKLNKSFFWSVSWTALKQIWLKLSKYCQLVFWWLRIFQLLKNVT